MKSIVQVGLTSIAATLLLFVANQVLQPIPVPAATATLGGLIGLWFGRKAQLSRIALGVAAGLLVGVGFHFYVHRTGQSPVPYEGLVAHLAADGGLGLMVGLLVLVTVFLVNKRLHR